MNSGCQLFVLKFLTAIVDDGCKGYLVFVLFWFCFFSLDGCCSGLYVANCSQNHRKAVYDSPKDHLFFFLYVSLLSSLELATDAIFRLGEHTKSTCSCVPLEPFTDKMASLKWT